MRSAASAADVSVYVLNMGQPVKIVDLAERMIRLSGLQPGYDIEIVFTGHAAGRAAERNPVRERGAGGRDRRRRHHGRQAERAADAERCGNGSRRSSRRSTKDDLVTIKAILKDAVPEFRLERRVITAGGFAGPATAGHDARSSCRKPAQHEQRLQRSGRERQDVASGGPAGPS